MLQREQLRTVFGGYVDGSTTGCPGYNSGCWSFDEGPKYRGCTCVSESHAKYGAKINGVTAYEDSFKCCSGIA